MHRHDRAFNRKLREDHLDHADALETIGFEELVASGVAADDSTGVCGIDAFQKLPKLSFEEERAPNERIAGRRSVTEYLRSPQRLAATATGIAPTSFASRRRQQNIEAHVTLRSPFTMTIWEACKAYNASEPTIYKRCRQQDGSIHALRIRDRWVIFRDKPYPASPYHDDLIARLRTQEYVGLGVAADIYGVTPTLLYRTCHAGETFIKFVKIGDRFFVKSTALLKELRLDELS